MQSSCLQPNGGTGVAGSLVNRYHRGDVVLKDEQISARRAAGVLRGRVAGRGGKCFPH